MPLIPRIDAGLSPILQWIVVPLAAFWWAMRPLNRDRRRGSTRETSGIVAAVLAGTGVVSLLVALSAVSDPVGAGELGTLPGSIASAIAGGSCLR